MRGCHGGGEQRDPFSHPSLWGLALSDQANTLHMVKNYAQIQIVLQGWDQVSSEALGSSREHSRAWGDPDAHTGTETSLTVQCWGPVGPQSPRAEWQGAEGHTTHLCSGQDQALVPHGGQ